MQIPDLRIRTALPDTLVADFAALQIGGQEAPPTPPPIGDEAYPNINVLPFMMPAAIPEALRALNLQSKSSAEVATIVSLLPEGTRELNLQGVNCKDIDFERVPSSLLSIKVSNISQAQLEALVHRCPLLRTLEVNHSNDIDNLECLSLLPALKDLRIYRSSGFSNLPHEMPKLHTLDVSSCSGIKELPHFSKYPELKVVRASFCNNLQRFHMIPRHHCIEVIDIRHCYRLKEIPPIVSDNLVELNCVGVQAKQALTFGSCPRLTLLNLSFCRHLLNIFGLNAERVPRLFRAELKGTFNSPAVYLAMQKIPRWVFLRT